MHTVGAQAVMPQVSEPSGVSLPRAAAGRAAQEADAVFPSCTCQRPLFGDDNWPDECPEHAPSRYIANNCCGPGQRQYDADNGRTAEADGRRDRRHGLREQLADCPGGHDALRRLPDGSSEVVVCDRCVTNYEPLAKRLKVCGTPMHNVARIRRRGGTAFVSDISTCGSLMCPVCGLKVRGRRAEEFGDAITRWLARGPDHEAWMVRLSARNTRDLPLSDGRDRALKGWQRLNNRKAWRRLREKYGLHYIRSMETTHGGNGWNVHLQPLILTRSGDSARVLADLYLTLRNLWPDIMGKLGFEAIPDVAVHIQQVDADKVLGAGAYLAKADAWGIGDEIARSDLKLGKTHGRSYEQIVGDYDDKLDDGDLALIREYHQVMHGRRLFSWSEGFRELLGLAPEVSDEELAAEEPDDAEDLAVIDGRVLYAMQRRRQLAGLLTEAERGGVQGICGYVARLGYPPGSVGISAVTVLYGKPL
jgi:hypothetical protein